MGKILKRCSLCKRYGAAYQVNDPQLGEIMLCYQCWHNKFSETHVKSDVTNQDQKNKLLKNQKSDT
ncbi:MAG: hypothetical protein CVU39_00730 [Chloroflexi bacterium HGW-Chloroflexi-10]|nr:MAG: hypothetical protein CVU39_00730 [Chloroflexi bacterium HGW-Chloroflexi-10]